MTFAKSAYNPDDFAATRHIGPKQSDIDQMLAAIGADSLDQLIKETVPDALRQKTDLSWPALSENDLLAHMRGVAAKNQVMTSLIGQGYYGTFTPPVIARNIFENPAWYTAYTPYQPEIAQGRLEALLNFQTMVADLTGLPMANASLLDEATAAAEAMAMAERASKTGAKQFFVDENCHPQTIAVIKTRAAPIGVQVLVGAPETLPKTGLFGGIFQYPGSYGDLRDLAPLAETLHGQGALMIAATDLLALCLLRDPGSMGVDMAVGSGQRFGVPMGYGGPHAAFFACSDALKRSMPGRIVGVSIDARGQKAYRLALQTREQHIRREKATSNVCTAQALLAVMASFYAIYHGPQGLRAIAERVHLNTHYVAQALVKAGIKICNQSYFDTLTLEVGANQAQLLADARALGMNFRKINDDRIGVSLDETTNDVVLQKILKVFGTKPPTDRPDTLGFAADFLRDTAFLSHGVFNQNGSEFELMRYMRRLSDRDLALDRAMIPLGSCTMKLNAAVEMMPLSWPEFSSLHPFSPLDQAVGYHEAMADLSQKLCEITGYDAISLQPNSGAQGEYAGLLTIQAYHQARGQGARNICLIPVSAHGTNPASAQMAGLEVVVVVSDGQGNIDVDDFRAKAKAAGDKLSSCMITYPSTHGVFEETLQEVCAITHQYGGMVYIDGANMNAMVGLVKPGDVGGDVSHLNLHKTFAIPHGGGGPGMGPIGVKAHLVPYLPGHPETNPDQGPVSAAAYGSASILLISWAYCLLMGGRGLTQATRIAILNANYIADRLNGAFEVMFRGAKGRVAHECILDTRPFAKHGVTVDDIAKRLIDNGFHAPTMSWPVVGTLMVEPTESENKTEIDRFIKALLSIRTEIDAIAAGDMPYDQSPLHHAPHTLEDLVSDWARPYARADGCFPPAAHRQDKYWPAVGRVDNIWGDRNLTCICPPLGDYL